MSEKKFIPLLEIFLIFVLFIIPKSCKNLLVSSVFSFPHWTEELLKWAALEKQSCICVDTQKRPDRTRNWLENLSVSMVYLYRILCEQGSQQIISSETIISQSYKLFTSIPFIRWFVVWYQVMSAEFSDKGQKISNSQFVKTCKWKITAKKRNLALWSRMRSLVNRGWKRGVRLGRDSKAFSTAPVRDTKVPELLRFRPVAFYEQRLVVERRNMLRNSGWTEICYVS